MTLRELLERHGLAAWVERFEAQQVTLMDLPELTEEDLLGGFGMSAFMDRKRFRAAVAELASGGTSFGSGLEGATRVGLPTPALAAVGGDLSGATRVGLPTPSPDTLSGGTRVGTSAAPTPAGPLAGGAWHGAVDGLPQRLGSYRILGGIGAGGMGTVVRARHVEEGWASRQGGDVAIKLVHPHLAADPSFRDRFFAEAELGRRVQHPGLVPTWDVLAEGSWLGTVMALVEGEPLSARVLPGGIGAEEVVRLLGPIAEALDHLHAQGIVHRDVKPANILVKRDGASVLLDLGIAKDTGSSSAHTRTMTAMGTTPWMAPEQADAKHVDGAADRYALGMIAYALLSGRMPWEEGTSEARLLVAKMTGQLVPLAQARAGLPAHVTEAVTRMIALAPGERFASCGDFLGAMKSDLATPTRDAARLIALEAAPARVGAPVAQVAVAAEDEPAVRERLVREARLRLEAEASARLELEAEKRRQAEQERLRQDALARLARSEEAARRACEAAERKVREEEALRAREAEAARRDSAESEAGRLLTQRVRSLERQRWSLPFEWDEGGGFLGLSRRRVSGVAQIEMVPVPACSFLMGSPAEQQGRYPDESQHRVVLSRSFAVATVPVTQMLWQAITGKQPSALRGEGVEQRPVENVSWYEAVRFCNVLSERLGLPLAYHIGAGEEPSVVCNFQAGGFRLPTEAEWECAARAGTLLPYAGSECLADVGWYEENSEGVTHVVAHRLANAWGLHDMSGNVSEWVWDGYAAYGTQTRHDPSGPPVAAGRVRRGGSWRLGEHAARVACRSFASPDTRESSVGLRLARTVP